MNGSFARAFASDITALAAGSSLEVDIGKPGLPHWFAAVEFFSDADGTQATPTAGTLVFTAEVLELPGVFQALTEGEVDISEANTSVNWLGSTTRVKVTGLNTVSGGSVTHFRLNINGARS